MRTFSSFAPALLVGALVGLAVSCGSKPPPPPDNPDRDLPTTSAHEHTRPGELANDSGIALTDKDAGICCMVRFAVTARSDETSATLRGDLDPFSTGTSMTLDQGAWSTTLCVPEEIESTYYVETTVPAANGSSFLLSRVNPNVPTEMGETQPLVNRFSFGDALTCSAFDGGIYGDLTPRAPFDAGTTDVDAGPGADAGTDAGTSTDAGADAGAASDAGTDAGVDAGTGIDAGDTTGGYVKTTVTGQCDVLGTPTDFFSGALVDEELSSITALPFTFTYFGSPMTHYAVSANGFMQLFTSAAGVPTQLRNNPAIPSAGAPNGVLAPMWDDLFAYDTTTVVRAETQGTGNARHLTVEWKNIGPLVDFNAFMTFQVKVFEGTNAIEFHYCELNANGSSNDFHLGGGATVGIESPDGLKGLQHSRDTATLSTATGLHFQ